MFTKIRVLLGLQCHRGQVLKSFIEHKEKEGVKKSTLALYRAALIKLLRWVQSNNGTFGPDLVADYYSYLRQITANATLVTYDGVYRECFAWAVKQGFIKESPFKDIPRPKLSRSANCTPYTPKEAEAIINRILDNKKLYCIRDATICGLFWDTHCRASGILGLRTDCINRTDRIIQVTEKGDRSRLVTYGNTAAKLLNIYLTDSIMHGEYVFPSRQGGHISHATIWRVIHDTCVEIGIPPRRVIHNFRGSSASDRLMHDPELSIESVQHMLGHTRKQTTEKFYIKNILPSITLRTMAKDSPLDRLAINV